jgi:hypothetical protein
MHVRVVGGIAFLAIPQSLDMGARTGGRLNQRRVDASQRLPAIACGSVMIAVYPVWPMRVSDTVTR